MPDSAGGLGRLLATLPITPVETGPAGAAVLALLRRGDRGIETLLIHRTDRPEDPAAGQVSLPGGRRDPADRGPLQTALREVREEVGIDRSDLAAPPRFLGIFRASAFGLEVAAFAAELARGGAAPRAVDTREVAEVFWLPEGELGRTRPVLRSTSRGPAEVEA
ncbi:MAG: NUDIX hydrolase, partial [Thermoplasmata archaeon]